MTWLIWRQYRARRRSPRCCSPRSPPCCSITGLQHGRAVARRCSPAAPPAAPAATSMRARCPLSSALGTIFVVLSLLAPALFGLCWGRAAGGARVRDRHQRLRLDAEHHPDAAGWRSRPAGCCSPPPSGAARSPPSSPGGPARATPRSRDAFQPNYFDQQGLVPVAYAVFAMALGHRGGRRAAPHAPGDRDRDRRVHRDAAVDLPGPPDALHDPGHHLLRGGGATSIPRRVPRFSAAALSTRPGSS